MTGWRRVAFVAVVTIQVAVLLGMIAQRLRLLRTGEVVLLQCQPVDPRSLFSGDYVVLNYTVSTFSRQELETMGGGDERFWRGQTLYVGLTEGDAEHWQAVALSTDPEEVRGPGRVVIRGVAVSVPPAARLRLRYGVEEYFVPQFEGVALEEALSRVSAEIAVAPSGESALKRLFLDGEEVVFR